jgi:hypothetical protein
MVQFKFRVYFENLSNRELGALCWVLHPLGDSSKDYCHSLGMAKPLGMGVVKLDATLYLTARATRYGSLFDGDNWQTGVSVTGKQLSDRNTLEELTREFEEHILSMLHPGRPCTHLSGLKRIGMLLKLLEWPGFPPQLPPTPDNRFLQSQSRPNTRYMSVQLPGVPSNQRNEYRDRPVLPDPSAFGILAGDVEPVVDATTPTVSFRPVSTGPLTQGGTPPATGFTGTRREKVALVGSARNGKVVRTEQGQEILCTGFPGYIPPGRRECRADVIRQDGKAIRAVFKAWI